MGPPLQLSQKLDIAKRTGVNSKNSSNIDNSNNKALMLFNGSLPPSQKKDDVKVLQGIEAPNYYID